MVGRGALTPPLIQTHLTTKSVYVEEGYDEDGEFSSRILTKAEVERLQSADALLAGGVGNSVNKSEDTASSGYYQILIYENFIIPKSDNKKNL